MEQVRSSSSLTCGSVAQVRPSRRVFLRRIVTLVLFVLPWGYVGVIAGVAVHEVVGHGLTALAVGGRFEGFELEWYGMGWASAYPAPGAPTWHASVVLLGGVTATVALGGLLLGPGTPRSPRGRAGCSRSERRVTRASPDRSVAALRSRHGCPFCSRTRSSVDAASTSVASGSRPE